MQKLLRWFAFSSALLVVGALRVIPMGAYQTVTSDSRGLETHVDVPPIRILQIGDDFVAGVAREDVDVETVVVLPRLKPKR